MTGFTIGGALGLLSVFWRDEPLAGFRADLPAIIVCEFAFCLALAVAGALIEGVVTL